MIKKEKIMRGRPIGSKCEHKIKRICKLCKKEFYVWPFKIKYNEGKYCSNKCKFKDRGKVKNICIVCKKKFLIYPYRIKEGGGKYCSIQCVGKSRIGKKLPIWWKNNMLKGRNSFKHSGGYIYIYHPNHPFCNASGYIFEHRLIMEKYLERYLRLEERVHHINGIKDDNRIENLKYFSNESKHVKYHHLLKGHKV